MLDLVSPAARRWVTRSVILACVTPMTVLLATRLTKLTVDPLLGSYAVLTVCTFTAVAYLSFACYRDPSEAPATSFEQPLVSCLVAARDEEENIERCVRSLLHSSYRGIEVIAVDDGSSDSTAERLTALAQSYDRLEVVLLPQ